MVVTIEDCKKVIQRYSNGTQEAIGFSVRTLCESPMGFLGDHFKLNIKTKSKADNEIKSIDFFLKTLPAGNPKHLEYVLSLGVFKKEALLYKNLLMDFQKFHKQQITPKCYLVNPDKFIVLQDLNRAGYANLDNELGLNEWVSLMKTMARFHASSVIFEEKRTYNTNKPYRLNDFHRDELKEATFVNSEGHPRKLWAINTSKAIADSMELLSDFAPESKCGDRLIEIVTGKIQEYTEASQKYRNVITHADLWKNNVMFSHGNEISSLLIDFQLARYVPPAFDILTTLYINCCPQFLNDNADYLLELYYNTFCGCLGAHNIDPQRIMSKEVYMESIEHYKMPALIEAAMFATIVFVSSELSDEMLKNEEVFNEFTYTDRSKYVKSEFANNPYFKERYGSILKQLVKSLEIYDI